MIQLRQSTRTIRALSRFAPCSSFVRYASSKPSTSQLAEFTSTLKYESIPPAVISRTKELFLDYICCSLAGKGYTSLAAMEKFAKVNGPSSGPCEVIAPGDGASKTSGPYFASLLNAAAGHIVEQDDLHMASVVHPATVVFPAALAAAQDLGSSGKDFLLASVAGYEAACRIGEMLGKEHYRIFHTTGTAGTLGAAAAVAKLLNLSPEQTLSAYGTAGTQAAGLWEFATDAAMSKQVHTAHAASTGLMSAYTAKDGLLGANDILLGKRGLAKGTAFGDESPELLMQGAGKEWKMTETSFKYWASCRHTHPSADALLAVLTKNNIATSDIKSITAKVYRAALDVLVPAQQGRTVHESKFSMGFVLATMAKKRSALLNDFQESDLADQELRELQKKVEMVHDEGIESEYPRRWVGHVFVETKDGKVYDERVDAVKGDPDNTLSREEIMEKGRSLAAYGGSVLSGDRLEKLFADVWALDEKKSLEGLVH
ncbi:2-methylcitrate dehydratase PrpD [Meredithblackwellia eburnea MCA 4105]